jgi:hypothetical protein
LQERDNADTHSFLAFWEHCGPVRLPKTGTRALSIAPETASILTKQVVGAEMHIQGGPEQTVVCTENLNPNVLTMKSAQYGARIYDAGSLNLARDRRIFVQ